MCCKTFPFCAGWLLPQLVFLIKLSLQINNQISMYSLSATNVTNHIDPPFYDLMLSPEYDSLVKRASLRDERYHSPKNTLEPVEQSSAPPRQPFKDISFERALPKTPNEKGKISFSRTPLLKQHSKKEGASHQGKSFNLASNKKGNMKYVFQPTNFQFSKKPSRGPRDSSHLAKESSLSGKENQHVLERPPRVSEPFQLKNPFENVQFNYVNRDQFKDHAVEHQRKHSENITTPFNLDISPCESKVTINPPAKPQEHHHQEVPPLIDRLKPFSELQTLTNSIIVQTTRPHQSPEPQSLCLDDFIKGKRLGKGHFGQVFVVKHKWTGFVCALKVISKEHIINERVTDQIIRQLKIHSCLKHPNVVQLYGFFSDQQNLYILQQLCTDGQIWDLLKKKMRVSEKYTAYIIRQLVEGLRYLHTNAVYHRDIKPENILIQDGIVKICDFGWAVHCMGMRNTRCGTPLYLSPEIVKGEAYDERVDIWGVGVMTYELITGSIPFRIYCEEDVKNIATDEVKFPPYLIITDHAKDFILRALTKDPKERVGLVDLLFHPFLSSVNEMDFISQKDQASIN